MEDWTRVVRRKAVCVTSEDHQKEINRLHKERVRLLTKQRVISEILIENDKELKEQCAAFLFLVSEI